VLAVVTGSRISKCTHPSAIFKEKETLHPQIPSPQADPDAMKCSGHGNEGKTRQNQNDQMKTKDAEKGLNGMLPVNMIC